MKTSNIQQALNKIQRTKDNLSKINGTQKYTFKEIFNDEFVSSHTNFQSISDFLNASGLDFSSQESFRNIDICALDKFISDNSDFSSWNEMKTTAGKLLIASQIGN